jgi:predicted phosphodiesterase
MPKLRLIGDAHGDEKQGIYGPWDEYIAHAQGAEQSLMVGDLDFVYSRILVLDPEKHKVIAGNHDNYDKSSCASCNGHGCAACSHRGYVFCQQTPHFLGDYGLWTPPSFTEPLFYLRGGYSIDKHHRLARGFGWWPEEELTYQQAMRALQFYAEHKPRIVVTHAAPKTVKHALFTDNVEIQSSATEEVLDQMWQLHQPDMWFFGHYHRTWEDMLTPETGGGSTHFRCLDILEAYDLTI